MITQEEHFRRLERMYLSAPVNKLYQPKIVIGEGLAEVEIQIRPDFFHSASAVHGAVIFKLLDDAAFFAVNSLEKDIFVLTASFNLYFLRPVASGELTSYGEVTFRSERLYVAESKVKDNKNRLIARGSGSFMLSKIPLSEDVGYV